MGQTSPQTGSEVEIEDDGDFTVTFSMSLPQQPAEDDESGPAARRARLARARSRGTASALSHR